MYQPQLPHAATRVWSEGLAHTICGTRVLFIDACAVEARTCVQPPANVPSGMLLYVLCIHTPTRVCACMRPCVWRLLAFRHWLRANDVLQCASVCYSVSGQGVALFLRNAEPEAEPQGLSVAVMAHASAAPRPERTRFAHLRHACN